jgi:hypothetical protein
MEPEGSLSRSQDPSTGAYPEPDHPSQHAHTLFLQDIFHCCSLINVDGSKWYIPSGKLHISPRPHFQLVPRSRTRGSIHPLLHTTPWCSA